MEEELGDPVPRLTRSATKSTRTPAERAGEDERPGKRGRAYLVSDADCHSNLRRSELRGAAPVGRSLGSLPSRKGIVQMGAGAGLIMDDASKRLWPMHPRLWPIQYPRLRPMHPRLWPMYSTLKM